MGREMGAALVRACELLSDFFQDVFHPAALEKRCCLDSRSLFPHSVEHDAQDGKSGHLDQSHDAQDQDANGFVTHGRLPRLWTKSKRLLKDIRSNTVGSS